MRKRLIPKPKFALRDVVIYWQQSEGNSPPQRAVGKVSKIHIQISEAGNSVRYSFEDNEESYDESDVTRRVLATQK